MNQMKFNTELQVDEVKSMPTGEVQVKASGPAGSDITLTFFMFPSETNNPRVNDSILVTIMTPAPSDGGPPND